jgi:formylglycine-generating enzyme required for sulfatase activity
MDLADATSNDTTKMKLQKTTIPLVRNSIKWSPRRRHFFLISLAAMVCVGLAFSAFAPNGIGPAAQSPTNETPVLGMIWIPPGTFVLGSPESDPDSSTDERPQTVVTLTKGFWMGAHEVTQAEYLAVTGSNPSFFTGDLNRPLERVSWNSAVAYCTTLTATERAAGRIPADWGYRLPTEAEWEYACRAGARTTRLGYGDDMSFTALTNYAWYHTNSDQTTHAVEQKLANPWGLMDMHGNVEEWCNDWYGTYPGGSVTNPTGPPTGTARLLRGGNWSSGPLHCRSARRDSDGFPTLTDRRIGFRVVLSSGQPGGKP